MRKLVVASIALTAAAALVVLGLPASAAGGPRSFKAHSKTVRAGQRVKVSGKGCGRQAFVRFYLNDIEIDTDRADRAGRFVDHVEIPTSMDLGRAEMKAGCSGYRVGTVTITVLGSRFDVEPRRVEAGELITITGSLWREAAGAAGTRPARGPGGDAGGDGGRLHPGDPPAPPRLTATP